MRHAMKHWYNIIAVNHAAPTEGARQQRPGGGQPPGEDGTVAVADGQSHARPRALAQRNGDQPRALR